VTAVNWFMTGVFDLLFRPFVGGPGWLSLIVFSVAASILGLLAYKYTSNQIAIKAVKDRIKARMLAIKLFKDDPLVMFKSFAGVLLCSLNILRYSLVPLAVMIIPFVLVMAQLGERYQWRPIRVGETVVITARLSPEIDLLSAEPRLEADQDVLAETVALRIPSQNEVLWRVKAGRPGTHTLRLHLAGQNATKTLTVGRRFERVNPLRCSSGFWNRLLHPSEPPLTEGSAVQFISIAYPDRPDWFCGATVWLLWLIGLSFVLAFLVKPLLRVEF